MCFEIFVLATLVSLVSKIQIIQFCSLFNMMNAFFGTPPASPARKSSSSSTSEVEGDEEKKLEAVLVGGEGSEEDGGEADGMRPKRRYTANTRYSFQNATQEAALSQGEVFDECDLRSVPLFSATAL